MRRIRRREIATGRDSLAAYLDLVERDPGELDLLARDILISVTSFFRDRDAFGVLRQGIASLCARKQPGSEIRVWVAGCASGEEAYSIAILIAEQLGERAAQFRVQIFATDLDDEALNVARRGVYPAAAMAEVAPEWLARYFTPTNQRYEASKALRDMIVFARHNLVSDPPFLRLDLVSCRNVLIYFDTPLQARVLQTFHFGLQKDGLLFLGRSESAVQADTLFHTLDRRERLFRRSGEASPPLASPQKITARTPWQRREQKAESLLAGLVSHFDATAILCDADGGILHTAGQVERYLQFPVGAAKLAVGEVIEPALRGELLTLLYRHNKQGKPQRGRRRRLGSEVVRIFVQPLTDVRLLLILIVPEQAPVVIDGEEAHPPSDRAVEDELLAAREHLQTLVEEMATANEEMQSLHEEAQASNEELQATNEELEAANEELQATNEELVSLNEELNVKTGEYLRLSEEYAHLYDALDFPILVFDRALQRVRFNAPAARRFDLRSGTLAQPLGRLKLGELTVSLESLLGLALAHREAQEDVCEIAARNLRLTATPGLDPVGEVRSLVVALIDVTEIVRAREALSVSERRLTALMEMTGVVFAMKSPTGVYLYADRRFAEFFHLDPAGCVGKTDFELFSQEFATDFWSLDLQALRARKPVVRVHAFDDEPGRRYLRTVHQVLHDADGKPAGFVVEGADITADRLAQEQLRITAEVFDQVGEAIVVTDSDCVIRTVNPAFKKITGYAPEDAIGQPLRVLKASYHSPELQDDIWRSLRDAGSWQGEFWNRRKNGETFPEWLTINRLDDEDGAVSHYVAVFSDITQLKDSQKRVEYLATHDTLTGLPNRALFNEQLRQALAQARRRRASFALLFVDLDDFKTINDTLGHDVGDEILKQAGQRLTRAVRDGDTVARLGGDEFTVILLDADANAATETARHFLDELATSFEVDGRILFLNASVGIAFYPDDGADSASLVKAADNAMYRAKEQGRNRMEFFKPDMQTRLLKRAAIERALREAIRADRLRLVYQPQFGLDTARALVGTEAADALA